jgi:hypothetical protein
MAEFNYMTFHRFKFHAPIKARDRQLRGPGSASYWLCGPARPLGVDRLINRVNSIWFGLAFYGDRAQAETVVDRAPHLLPDCADATETWHAALCPISHRGQTNWFGAVEDAQQFRPSKKDPGGLLVVMTSAGFNVLPADDLKVDLPRRLDFVANVDRVLEWFATLPGNLVRENYEVGAPVTDGLTFSLWRSDEDMLKAAYHPGIHRTQLERYKSEHTADRTSFTRARLIACSGTWDGANPANL